MEVDNNNCFYPPLFRCSVTVTAGECTLFYIHLVTIETSGGTVITTGATGAQKEAIAVWGKISQFISGGASSFYCYFPLSDFKFRKYGSILALRRFLSTTIINPSK